MSPKVTQGYSKLTLTRLDYCQSQTVTFYNPVLQSVLKTIDWENKAIHLTFAILNSVFLTQNRYFAFFAFHILGANWKKGGGGGGGGDICVYTERLGPYTILLG